MNGKIRAIRVNFEVLVAVEFPQWKCKKKKIIDNSASLEWHGVAATQLENMQFVQAKIIKLLGIKFRI